jgi:membrane-bound lytic murein transglycosylase D
MIKSKFSLFAILIFIFQSASISICYSQEEVADTTTTVQAEVLPTVDGETIRQRLALLQSSVPLVYNEYVHSFVDFFTYRKPSFTKTMLERKNYFFPIFEEQLRKYNIPDEIKYLSLIESGLNPKAISYAGAAGLWQFMPKTGRIDFGLRVDKFIDERHHVLKSTEAACKYMKQLYNIFGNWELVLAAYNTGPGNVKRAIRKAGGGGFWEIYPYLHKQTRSYVPQYVAMIYMMHYASDYGIFPDKDEVIPNSSPIMVSKYLNLTTFASLANIPYESLMMVNPHILTKELPENTHNLILSIPDSNYAYFDMNRQMILDSASKRVFPIINSIPTITPTNDTTEMLAGKVKNGKKSKNNTTNEVGSDEKRILADNGPDEFEDVAKKKPKVKYHVIKRGENLFQIASRYNVDMYDIKAWNNIKKSSDIKYGRKLKLYLENAAIKADVFAKNAEKDEENERKAISKQKLAKSNSKIAKVDNKSEATAKVHVVKRGENLSSIADKYNVDVTDIKDWNGLNNNKINSGQKLKISGATVKNSKSDKSDRAELAKDDNTKPKFHVVLKGDTIWSIAQRYEGSSVDKIRRLNDIKNNNLKPGQKIRVT